MKNINWKQSLLTAIITILVTVAGGMVLYYLQFHKAEITYSIEKIPPFKSQNGSFNITHIKIENSGNDVAEDVKCEINISPAYIADHVINSDSPIEFKTIKDSTKLIVTTSNLNENEKFQISLLLNTNSSFPEVPIVKLRAKGINGLELQEAKNEKEDLPFWQLLIMLSAAVTSLTLSIRGVLKSRGRPDQSQVYLFLV